MTTIYASMNKWRSPAAQMEMRFLPETTRDGITMYLEGGCRHLGDFLENVLKGNLAIAIDHADDEHVRALGDIVKWLRKWAVPGSWGSEQKVEDFRQSLSVARAIASAS